MRNHIEEPLAMSGGSDGFSFSLSLVALFVWCRIYNQGAVQRKAKRRVGGTESSKQWYASNSIPKRTPTYRELAVFSR